MLNSSLASVYGLYMANLNDRIFMKYFLKTFLLLFFLGLIFSSCKKESADSVSETKTINAKPAGLALANQDEVKVAEKIIVLNKEEKMPVWLYGKANANTILVMVHGGPGSNVLDYRNLNQGLAFKRLENNHIVAYWQQRASGESQGPDNSNYYTIQQYAEDCDMVVKKLKAKYPDKRIVLMGHSWGGMLIPFYLRSQIRRAKIAAWINIDGLHNGTTFLQSSIQDLNAEADKRIALQQNVSYWNSVKNDISKYPTAANPLSYSCIAYIPEVKIKVYPQNFTSFTSRATNSNRKIFPVVLNTDNTSYLKSYTLPTLVLWGKYDYSVSKRTRDQMLANSGSTKLVNKEFSVSSHFPMFQEPDQFAESIESFIKSF